MVNRKISPDMKQRALQLIDEGWELAKLADVFGVSSKSIERWDHNYKTHGCVDPPSGLRGRPRILTTQAINDLQELIRETPLLFLDEIGEWLALYHDISISTTALHYNLRELGLTYKLLRKAAAERDDIARSEWLLEITTLYTADQLVVLDETSKDNRTICRRYGRAPRGEDPVVEVPLERGVRYSILPALTIEGYLAVRVVEGSIDGAEFYDFVVNDVLPCMEPFPCPRSVMLIDNCSTHKSEAVREAVEASGCRYIFLPPYSPDYSPIEESFSCVKNYLRRHYGQFRNSLFPERDLADACFAAVTPEKAKGCRAGLDCYSAMLVT